LSRTNRSSPPVSLVLCVPSVYTGVLLVLDPSEKIRLSFCRPRSGRTSSSRPDRPGHTAPQPAARPTRRPPRGVDHRFVSSDKPLCQCANVCGITAKGNHFLHRQPYASRPNAPMANSARMQGSGTEVATQMSVSPKPPGGLYRDSAPKRGGKPLTNMLDLIEDRIVLCIRVVWI